jgi:hypothetical protein
MINQQKLSKHWNSLSSVQKNSVMESLSKNQLSGVPQIDQFLLNNSTKDLLKSLVSQFGGVVPISMGNFKNNEDPNFLRQKANFEKDFPGYSLFVNEKKGPNEGRVYIFNTSTMEALEEYYEESLPAFKEQQKALKTQAKTQTAQTQTQAKTQNNVTLQDNLKLVQDLKSKLESLKSQSEQISQLQAQLQQQTTECESRIQKATTDLQAQLTQSQSSVSSLQQQLETAKQQTTSSTSSSQEMNTLNQALRQLLSA